MNNKIPEIYNSIQEIAWNFGNHGINGECCRDLSLVEFMALKNAYENENISIQEIGNALNFTKSGATRIINRLESKGYVIRQRSIIDGRVCCITLTKKGTEAIAQITEQYIHYLEEVLKDLEPQMINNIKDVLEILVESVRKSQLVTTVK